MQRKLDLHRAVIGGYELKLKLTANPGIEFLDISETPISDLSFLESLQLDSLGELDISVTPLTSLEPLRFLKNLKILHANQLFKLSDPTGIQYLTGLEELYMEQSHIENLEHFKQLTNLKVLDLGENKNVRDISPLAVLKKLEKLFLVGTRINTREQLLSLKQAILKYF